MEHTVSARTTVLERPQEGGIPARSTGRYAPDCRAGIDLILHVTEVFNCGITARGLDMHQGASPRTFCAWYLSTWILPPCMAGPAQQRAGFCPTQAQPLPQHDSGAHTHLLPIRAQQPVRPAAGESQGLSSVLSLKPTPNRVTVGRLLQNAATRASLHDWRGRCGQPATRHTTSSGSSGSRQDGADVWAASGLRRHGTPHEPGRFAAAACR